MQTLPSLAETYEQIVRDQEPNFLRLYLNPHVAQTCFALDFYMRTTWLEPSTASAPKPASSEPCQTFLANGLEEALSGAIKLIRFNQHAAGLLSTGLILDPAKRLPSFVSAELASGESVRFLPGLRVLGSDELTVEPDKLRLEGADGESEETAAVVNLLVLVAEVDGLLDRHAEPLRTLVRRHRPLVITCLNRQTLASIRDGARGIYREIVPDVVVFDESFVDYVVPFSAFTARQSLFACWNRPGKATFHSTTYQPNTISTLHFMRCLATADREGYETNADTFQHVLQDGSQRGNVFRRYYSPALFRLIRATGFETTDVRASGSFIVADGRRIFDAVSGVACSFRGHNPAAYADEMATARSAPGEAELRNRLQRLTGLEHFLPAVSGATAVENALKLALMASFPRRHVLALKAGFGGKTLLSLTGTANPAYKEHIDPLYADVHYVDPFAPDARAQIDALLERHEFAVVQVELIQAVGGVRRVPDNIIRHLDAGRERSGYLLLVDEVQTGMFRTGPFILSQSLDLKPDFLLLGKAVSDMMFPFALTVYSAAVHELLKRRGSSLPEIIRNRYGYEQGYKTVANVLRLGQELDVSRQVAEAGALVSERLHAGLALKQIVREVRVFGLLIGVELDTRRWPQRWLHKRLSSFYLYSMLRHEHFPVLAGLCQYEPNVLKITPPLNSSREEIERACDTIIDVLSRPLRDVLAAGLGGLIKSSTFPRKHHERRNDSAHKLVGV